MKDCKFNSMEVAELVHSEAGTQAVFIVANQNLANIIGGRIGVAARRYNTVISYVTHIMIDQSTLEANIILLATVNKAGRELKPRGRTALRKMATCHPDKPVIAKGLCRACYDKERKRLKERIKTM